MTKITVSQTYNWHFREPDNSFNSSGKMLFKVPLPNELIADVTVDCLNHKVHITIQELDVSENFRETVLSQRDLSSLPESTQKELREITSKLHLAHKKILSLIKYHLNFPELFDTIYSTDLAEWSYDGDKYKLPISLIFEFEIIKIRESISTITQGMLQASLDASVEPLLGMQYLHRAENSMEPNYKWIAATIAAELAVKEVLVRKHPNLKIIFEELPSPPLTKLYGSIMREYLGEESPYKRIFEKGVEIRNKLVHRPGFHEIDKQQASDYVRKVEVSILHLLTLVYPNDALTASYYEFAKSNLGESKVVSIEKSI